MHLKSPLSFLLLLLLFPLLTWSGCNKCKNVDCQKGECVRGECICDFGWEGSNCAVSFREKFIGNWDGASFCNSGIGNFNVSVAAGATNDLSLDITNLYDSGATVSGEMVSSTRLTIPSQALGSTTVSGYGVYTESSGLIQIFYTVGNSNPAEDCVVELTQP